MKNTMNKVLSVVLACIMVLGLLPVTALATQTAQSTVEAWNLVLADEIAVNFHVSIENAAEDAVMRVTDGYTTTDYPLSQAEKTAEGNYLFTGRLAAAQMADEITLQLISGEEAGEVHTYTAAQYAEAVLTGEYKQSAKDLVLAMINYGAAAQNYFDYNTEKLANAGYVAEPTAEIPAVSGVATEGGVSGLTLYGASLLFQSRVAVRFYFTGSVEGLTFSAGEPAQKNGLYYVDVTGINPQDYDKEITLTVTDGADTLSVSYSPLAYISRQYAKSSNEALRNLVANMYQYHIAAEKYLSDSANGNVTTDGNGIVTEQVILSGEKSSAVVAAGTQLDANTTELTLSVTAMDETDAEVELAENESLISMDVYVEGISKDNTVPVLVTLDELAPEFLNKGNIALYHVENGVTVEMTRVYSAEELDAHNEYYYDIATGTVTVALASFSTVAVVADEENAWDGDRDYTWYNADATEYVIYNADQLAGFGAIVGGMIEGIEQDSFADKTVTLMADIDIGDLDSENGIVFYPIGYNSSDGKYEKTGVAVSTGFYSFYGTFDGNGHTISDFYQNTWEMKGDHDWYAPEEQYFRDGMGLFGKVYGGTVKNLTVKNFSSDGEITTTGVIAAYADCGATFENITIFNCNPRVYNIGNGGIVGCVGWYAKETVDTPVTFKNITVDNSNKISALWGSYDVACGGIVGQYYPTSGQSSANYPKNAGIYLENCHVAAQMDVYNDVCANYQYYAYRYAGMLIGSVRENQQGDGSALYPETGRVYPKMDGITASGCTVHYDTWNDYYYCELVANSLASYTHDHQMSRLTQVTSVDVENKTVTPLKGETTAIPESGRYNYVVVNGEHATENATCYHFVDGKVWNHADAETETVDGETVLKEDKQHIYLPFAQLFTGYGWGVTSAGIGDYEGVDVEHVDQKDSVEKFEAAEGVKTEYAPGDVLTIGELFQAAGADVAIDTDNVQVFVSPVDEGEVKSTVKGTYVANKTDWTKGVLVLVGSGKATVTITDYNYCNEYTLDINVVAQTIGSTEGAYVKVTEEPADWSGEYLIVYEDGSLIMDGSLIEDANDNLQSVTITDNTISAEEGDPYKFTIEPMNGGYSIKTASGLYIGGENDKNKIVYNNSAILNTIEFANGGVSIKSNSTYLRYRYDPSSSPAQNRFRYFKTNSYHAIALYKLIESNDGTEGSCNHENAVITINTADCENAGSVMIECSCGAETQEVLAAWGHSYEEKVTTEPNCTEEGVKTGTCSVCGETVTEMIPATGEHNYVDGACDICGTKEPNGWQLVTDVSTLKVEDKIIIVAVDANYALSTEQKTNNRGVASVTKDGNTVTFADDAGVQIITLEVGTVNGTFAFNVGDGYLYAASSSGNQLKTQGEIKDNGSWLITIVDGVATIVAQGTTSRNTMQYNPNNGSPLFACYASASQGAIAIYRNTHEHTGGEGVVTAPTCTEVGYTTYTCTKCGESYTVEGEPATGHTMDEGKITTGATCTTAGVKTYSCANCDYTETEEIPATGHQNTTTTTVNATCTEDGSITVTCACGETVSTEVIEAIGHDYVDGTCSVCGAAESIVTETTTKYTFSDYTAGTQYAENEEHKLDDDVTVVTTKCHFTTQLRIYSSNTYNGYAIIKCTGAISKIAVNAGNKVDKLVIYGSNDEGDTWTEAGTISVTSTSYKNYEITLNGEYKWLKIDVEGSNQVRLQSMTLTYKKES